MQGRSGQVEIAVTGPALKHGVVKVVRLFAGWGEGYRSWGERCRRIDILDGTDPSIVYPMLPEDKLWV